jgi:hypothetical protein
MEKLKRLKFDKKSVLRLFSARISLLVQYSLFADIRGYLLGSGICRYSLFLQENNHLVIYTGWSSGIL